MVLDRYRLKNVPFVSKVNKIVEKDTEVATIDSTKKSVSRKYTNKGTGTSYRFSSNFD